MTQHGASGPSAGAVAAQLVRSARFAGVRDERVLDAMAKVDREQFISARYAPDVARDDALPIGYQQTTSQPSLIALMLEVLQLEPDDVVLEVGTGLGYEAAILSHLVRSVWTIERVPELAEEARRRLAAAGLTNVTVVLGDGSLGAPDAAPFDAAVVAAAATAVPEAIVEQLRPGARVVIPLRSGTPFGGEEVLCLEKHGDGLDLVERVCPARFVPLVTGADR